MKLVHDAEDDIASLQLTDEIAEGEVAQVVGPQLTPTGDRIVLAYDSEDFLVRIEIEGADRVLRDETLG